MRTHEAVFAINRKSVLFSVSLSRQYFRRFGMLNCRMQVVALGLLLGSGVGFVLNAHAVQCNNRESRFGTCVSDSACSPAQPNPGDPNANPPVPPKPCGGATIKSNGIALRCEKGPTGAHCRDLYKWPACAYNGTCSLNLQSGDCEPIYPTVAGVTGWTTVIESIPCVLQPQG